MIKKVLLDMDGVLYDWMHSCAKLFGVDDETQFARDYFKENDADDIWGRETVFQKIEEHGPNFWYDLRTLPWCGPLYTRLSKLSKTKGFELGFCSSPGKHVDAATVKAMVIERDFGHFDNLVLARLKSLCASPDTLLIDDSEWNIEQFVMAGGQGFLWPNQYKLMDGEIDLGATVGALLIQILKR